MYEYHNNKLSIPAHLLYEDWELVSYSNYLALCKRGKLVRTKEARGLGNIAFVSVYDLPVHRGVDFKKRCFKELGNPKDVIVVNHLENYIFPDSKAAQFFAEHRKPDGKALSFEQQREKATSAMILNAITYMLADKKALNRKSNKWEEITNAVNHLATMTIDANGNSEPKWHFKLPGNQRALQRKYNAYIKNEYAEFLHKGEGSKNARIIKDEIGDYLISQFALPIKLSIPEVMQRYEVERKVRGWKTLTESAVYNFLHQPENERIWTIGRHDKKTWARKYKHTITRDKSEWFPNVYWAIDGSKLDWIHVWEDSSNKMGSQLKKDVVFDVYSEKLIGWSLGFSERHEEHFRAIKKAVNEAQCRPYYLTYDHQSGHMSGRMQNLYDSLIAKEGGFHHANKAKSTHGPAENLIGMFQQQVVNNFWFSDGQSITVKRDDSKMNIDFIEENRAMLKTVEELYDAWETAVNIWNNSPHSVYKNKTRNEVYNEEMPMKEELHLLDIIDKMWIEERKYPITYKAHGLQIEIDGEKQLFEVYDANNEIDTEFRRKSVGKKFIVRYDPDNLDYIQLFEKDFDGNPVFVANAEPKRKHQNIPVLMKEGDKEWWRKDYEVRDEEYNRDLLALQKIRERTGITPEQEMEDQELLIKFRGNATKVQREKAEAAEKMYDF